MKKYFPVVLFVLSIVILNSIVVILSTLSLRMGQNRLEQNLVVVEDSQYQCLKAIYGKEATKSATPSAKTVVGSK